MVTINFRTDEDVKKEAEKLFDELGLNLSVAINMFLKQAIRERGIPFDLTLNIPNSETQAAIEEAKRIAKDPNVKSYKDIESLRKALEV